MTKEERLARRRERERQLKLDPAYRARKAAYDKQYAEKQRNAPEGRAARLRTVRKWRAKHKDKLTERDKKYWETLPLERKEAVRLRNNKRMRRLYEKDKEQRKRIAVYKKSNREKYNDYEARRRLVRKLNEELHEAAE